MKNALAKAAITLTCYGLIGAGAYMVYRPAGFLAVGLLMWIEMLLARLK